MSSIDPVEPFHERSARRRSRAELETLAAEFVAAPPADAASRTPPITFALGGVLILATVVAAVLIVSPDPDADTAPRVQTALAPGDAQLWQQRLAAERARKRRDLESGVRYLDKLAQEDYAALDAFRQQPGDAFAPTSAARAARETDAAVRDATASALPAAEPAPSERTVSPPTTGLTAAPTPEPPAADSPPAGSGSTPATTGTAAPTPAAASPSVAASGESARCNIHVSQLSESGTLTYDAVSRLKGSRVDRASGHVFTAPVNVGGRAVVFEVLPDGCVRIVRSSAR